VLTSFEVPLKRRAWDLTLFCPSAAGPGPTSPIFSSRPFPHGKPFLGSPRAMTPGDKRVLCGSISRPLGDSGANQRLNQIRAALPLIPRAHCQRARVILAARFFVILVFDFISAAQVQVNRRCG